MPSKQEMREAWQVFRAFLNDDEFSIALKNPVNWLKALAGAAVVYAVALAIWVLA